MRFCTNRDGNFATIFALSVLPVVMVGGMGIDYGTNIAVRQKAQNAVDATVLTLAKLSTTTSDQDLQAKAETQVKALLSDRRLRNPVVTAKRDGDTIWVGILGNTPTSLTSIAGFSQMPVDVSAVVRRGSGNLEVALVLDNTGSMKGAKLANLKSAATSLVESMFREADPAKPNALKMAVVPFSMTVNVGSSYGNAGFMDVDAKSSIHKEIFAVKDATANRFSLFGKMKVAWAECVETRPTPYDVQERVRRPPQSRILYIFPILHRMSRTTTTAQSMITCRIIRSAPGIKARTTVRVKGRPRNTVPTGSRHPPTILSPEPATAMGQMPGARSSR